MRSSSRFRILTFAFLFFCVMLPLSESEYSARNNSGRESVFIYNKPNEIDIYDELENDIIPKTSVNVDPFEIVGNDGWADLAESESWCTGNGTEEDPYVINNITVDAEYQGSCLSIHGSSVHFKIEKSNFLRSGDLYDFHSAIDLYQVENGVIYKCNLYGNNGYGLSGSHYGQALNMKDCENITIDYNVFSQNEEEGMVIRDCKNVNIFRNSMTQHNGYKVIDIEDCENVTLITNYLMDNQMTSRGFFIYNTDNCSLRSNYVSEQGGYGLHFIDSTGIDMEDDVFEYCYLTGVVMDLITDFTIKSCEFKNNSGNGIWIHDSESGEVVNCNITDNLNHGWGTGLKLEYSTAINITNCRLEDNIAIDERIGSAPDFAYGMEMLESDDCRIVGCTIINNSGGGIYMSRSDGNLIDFCQIELNNRQIPDVVNEGTGIYIQISNHHNNISNCIIRNNYKGMWISSDFNRFQIKNNHIEKNFEHGILMDGSLRGKMEYNLIENTGNLSQKEGIGIEMIGYGAYLNITNNWFRNNGGENALDDDGYANWHEGTIGNFWDDYTGVDVSPHDGRGDTPYEINGSGLNTDPYPMVGSPIFTKGKDGTPLHVDGMGINGISFAYLKTRWWSITGDVEERLKGDGTKDDPYILEKLTIDGNETDGCMSIENEDVHYVVKNCILYNASSENSSLLIKNTMNGLIRDVIIAENHDRGILVENTDNITVKNSTISNCDGDGIKAMNVSTIELIDNDIFSVHIAINITDNIFSNITDVEAEFASSTGMFLKRVNHVHFYQNSISYTIAEGAYFEDVNFSLIHDNEINHADGHGFHFNGVNNSEIFNNEVFYGGSDGLYFQNCEKNNITLNAIVENNGNGIKIVGGNITRLCNNHVNGNDQWGISMELFSDDVIICDNEALNNLNGIEIIGNFYKGLNITQNYIFNNFFDGVNIENVSHLVIFNNDITDSGLNGIYLEAVRKASITQNEIDGSLTTGIYIDNCSSIFISDNDIGDTEGDAIYVNGGCLINITINLIIGSFDAGVYLFHSHKNVIIDNTIVGAEDCLVLEQSTFNYIYKNDFNSPDNMGVHFFSSSHNNTFVENIVRFSAGIGILMDASWNNTISDCEIGYCVDGIKSVDNYNQTITDNTIESNDNGIILVRSFYHRIWNNLIEDSALNGIKISDTGLNWYWNNDIEDSGQYAVYIVDASCTSNTFWQNNFLNSGTMNALDDGLVNYWDNGTIGNYWDDYNGHDLYGDGIGDTPFNITGNNLGSQDRYPIWNVPDTFDPVIIIHEPQPLDGFGHDPPYFNITIDEYWLSVAWYSLDNGTTKFYNASLADKLFQANWHGQVDQTEWNKYGNGFITFTFYAEDIVGNSKTKKIVINKDLFPPIATVNDPTAFDILGIDAPNYDLTVVEDNLDTMLYFFGNGTYNTSKVIFTSFSGTFNQATWDLMGNGTLIIYFFINDTLGHLTEEEVVVRKDTSIPTITILKPNEDEVYENEIPPFLITASGSNLDETWYVIGDSDRHAFTGNAGFFDGQLWIDQPDGAVIIKFFVSNLAGAQNHSEVIVFKTTVSPNITIINPKEGEIFGIQQPEYEIIAENSSTIVKMWYEVSGFGNKYVIINTTGEINEYLWTQVDDGETVIITFYIENEWGGIASESVTVTKDLSPDDESWLEMLVNFIIGIILAILSLFGIVILLKRRRSQRSDPFRALEI